MPERTAYPSTMRSMDFEIRGHSGCHLTVCREGDGLAVVKSTGDACYAERLYRQARKQQEFGEQDNPAVRAPKVFAISQTRSTCSVKMEFVYGQNFVEFFEYAGLERLTTFVDTVLSFIQGELGGSPLQQVDGSVIQHKYGSVREHVLSNSAVAGHPEIQRHFHTLDRILDRKYDMVLPVGICHGDLTLSNILFCGSRVYLVDFLDSFIETPLVDIIKLRQDTRYGWSFLMVRRPYDRVRHQIILDHIDQCIVSRFQEEPFYRDHYVLLQLMNFLRVLQYAHEPVVIEYLTRVIGELILQHEQEYSDHPGGGRPAGI